MRKLKVLCGSVAILQYKVRDQCKDRIGLTCANSIVRADPVHSYRMAPRSSFLLSFKSPLFKSVVTSRTCFSNTHTVDSIAAHCPFLLSHRAKLFNGGK